MDAGIEPHWHLCGGPYGSPRTAVRAGDAAMKDFPISKLGQAYNLEAYLIVPHYKMAQYGFLTYGEHRQPLPGIDKVGP
jgi:hypothetical protein